MTAFHLETIQGVVTLTFDYPNEKINKLTSEVMGELDTMLEEISKTPNLKALVLKSAKRDIFIAGADIAEIRSITEPEEGVLKAKAGQAVLNKLSALEIPTIAVIDGATLGGGLELALACSYRVVSDNPRVQLGLPEVSLGIIPGFGGTQRLPRLIGLRNGLDLILTGKSVDGKKAYKLGLADAFFTQSFIEESLQIFLATIFTSKGKEVTLKRRRPKGFLGWFLERTFLGRRLVYKTAKKTVMEKSKGHYPAPLAALQVIKSTFCGSLTKGLDVEAKAFSLLVPTQISKNLIQLFFVQEELKKYAGVSQPIPIATLQDSGVLGAGLMGGGIGWLLSSVGISVRLKDVQWEAIAKGFSSASKIYDKLVKIKKKTAREVGLSMQLISGTTDYSGFQKTDIVIEAIVEDITIKKKVFQELEGYIRPETIIASNTSSLSISEMAEGLAHPERFIGMHFFSPVNKMPLVEVIPGEKTSDEAIASVVQLAKTMKKTPIVVKNVPGFLVNRILIPYVNEAICLLQEGVSVQVLDHAIESFGMPLGPLALADEVGLDIGYKVAKLLEKGYGERMAVAKAFEVLFADPELRGKKTQKGFYLHSDAKKVPNPKVEALLKSCKVQGVDVSVATAVDRMILLMVNEAARCLEEGVVQKPEHLDMAMILGTGFPPFLGGLCRYADQRGISEICQKLEGFKTQYGMRFEPAKRLIQMAQENKMFYTL